MIDNVNQSIKIMISHENPFITNMASFRATLDIITIPSVDILQLFNAAKYIEGYSYIYEGGTISDEEWLEIPRKYWNDVVNECKRAIRNICIDIAANDDMTNINDQVNLIKKLSEIAFKLQYIFDNYTERDAPSIYVDMSDSDIDVLGLDMC